VIRAISSPLEPVEIGVVGHLLQVEVEDVYPVFLGGVRKFT
jgi:hypothetical protein